MVSAWDVYWVMQLDSISSALTFASVLAGFVTLWLAAFAATCYGANPDEWSAPSNKASAERQRAAFPAARAAATKAAWAFLALTAFAALLPSSKTAAAMIVLPALTSDQVVAPLTGEAAELYGLAKQALTNVVERTESTPKEATK